MTDKIIKVELSILIKFFLIQFIYNSFNSLEGFKFCVID